jgi:hypothetical protein
MAKEQLLRDEKKASIHKQKELDSAEHYESRSGPEASLNSLQQQVGNRAVQRLIAQREGGEGSFELDDETSERINHQRGGGQPLDSNLAAQMSQATGNDYGDVRVHTSPEADALNKDLNAEAFTTGRDIFFREGAYQPGTASGKKLIFHEGAHVDQQASGAVQSSTSGKMTVNAPNDAFEKEADAIAQQVTSPAPPVQRQALTEEPEEREEEVQAKRIQRAVSSDDEEPLQMKIQRQELPEEREDETET